MSNGSSDIDFKDIMMLHKDYTKEPNSFLVNDATLGKWMFVRKSKQSEKKQKKQRAKQSSKQSVTLLLYRREILNWIFYWQRCFTRRRLARNRCCIEKIWIFTIAEKQYQKNYISFLSMIKKKNQ